MYQIEDIFDDTSVKGEKSTDSSSPVKSPICYPGGKSSAKEILYDIASQHFDMDAITDIVSPFLGGGSFEMHLLNQLPNVQLIANDAFNYLINFWNQLKVNKDQLCQMISEVQTPITKELHDSMKAEIDSQSGVHQAVTFYVMNQVCYNAIFGHYSSAKAKAFNPNKLHKLNLDLTRCEFHNKDYQEFLRPIVQIMGHESTLVFLDPPYYLGSGSTLYGSKGELHKDFDHERLATFLIEECHCPWMMTYNDCEYIRELYKNHNIIDVEWKYRMNKSKESSEIVILGKGNTSQESNTIGEVASGLAFGAACTLPYLSLIP